MLSVSGKHDEPVIPIIGDTINAVVTGSGRSEMVGLVCTVL